MKSIFGILIVILAASISIESAKLSKAERDAAFKTVAEKCKADTGATDADLELVIQRKPDSTKTGRCLRECLMTKFEIISDGKLSKPGLIVVANILYEEDQDKIKLAEKGIDKCLPIQVSSDKCDAAEEYLDCLKKQAQELGLALEL